MPVSYKEKLEKFKLNEKISPKEALARGASYVTVYEQGEMVSVVKSARAKRANMKGTVWGYGYDVRSKKVDVSIDLPRKRRVSGK